MAQLTQADVDALNTASGATLTVAQANLILNQLMPVIGDRRELERLVSNVYSSMLIMYQWLLGAQPKAVQLSMLLNHLNAWRAAWPGLNLPDPAVTLPNAG